MPGSCRHRAGRPHLALPLAQRHPPLHPCPSPRPPLPLHPPSLPRHCPSPHLFPHSTMRKRSRNSRERCTLYSSTLTVQPPPQPPSTPHQSSPRRPLHLCLPSPLPPPPHHLHPPPLPTRTRTQTWTQRLPSPPPPPLLLAHHRPPPRRRHLPPRSPRFILLRSRRTLPLLVRARRRTARVVGRAWSAWAFLDWERHTHREREGDTQIGRASCRERVSSPV